jgi:hypothetical protein
MRVLWLDEVEDSGHGWEVGIGLRYQLNGTVRSSPAYQAGVAGASPVFLVADLNFPLFAGGFTIPSPLRLHLKVRRPLFKPL